MTDECKPIFSIDRALEDGGGGRREVSFDKKLGDREMKSILIRNIKGLKEKKKEKKKRKNL